MSEERETLTVAKPKTEDIRAAISEGDWVKMMNLPEFKRILFTVFDLAGMFRGNYGTDGRNLAFAEGRRSLGLDILRTAEAYAGRDALLHILSEEMKTSERTPNGRRSSYTRTRTAELGSADPRTVDDGGGLAYADYGNEPTG